MSKRLKVELVKYSVAAAIVALIAWTYVDLRDFEGAVLMEKYRMLCDAFTIPGVILVMIAGMCWVAGQGALDGLSYCVRFAVYSLIPGKRVERDEKFADYVIRRRGKRSQGYGFLFWSGLAALLIAGVFMYLFYSLYNQ